MSVATTRIRGRPAHTPGSTSLSYTPNGRQLITAGSNNAIRVYTTGSDGEPRTLDEAQESNAAVVAGSDFFITGAEDGTVWMWDMQKGEMETMLVRCALPVRDLALSKGGDWVCVASDELTVKVVNTKDMTRTLYLREQTKGVKHVTFDPSGTYVTVSCSDGVIYLYSISKEEPELVRKIDGVIRRLETDAEASSRAVWHPEGRAFAVATATRDIVVVSSGDGEKQKVFSDGHLGDITALAWSPNGSLLASAGADRKVVLWESKTQKIIARYDYSNVTNLAWHPTENILSFTTSDGELFIYENFVPAEHADMLKRGMQPAPLLRDALKEVAGNVQKVVADGYQKHDREDRHMRDATPDSLDDILGVDDEADDFIEDDDGAGYAEKSNGKRNGDHLDDIYGHVDKKRPNPAYSLWKPRIHEPFQPSSTPWRGSRRYLCLNLVGFVWTVDQETHNTVTVEFYDREYHRDFHFTDPFLWDKACLNENGTLFSCPPNDLTPAMIFYRPHETWTTRSDWRTSLPEGEDITAISLSDSFVVVTTSTNYVRVYTLFGTPFRVYRQKSMPAVTCASWRDYVLTMGNGAVGGDGKTRLVYTIENVKRDEVLQNEDTVALTEGAELKSVFFSDNGDPCIYDSTGVLLVLQHWRTPGQARWTPLLDTKLLDRLASGRKEETYFPVAVAEDKFHCIILKGGDKYPYFPRPLLSEFEFKVPVGSIPAENEDEDAETEGRKNDGSRLEETYVRNSILLSLLEDLVSATSSSHTQRTELARREVEVDKTLLQLLAVECREGEDRGMKALEIVGLMRDRGGKMIEAAGKVAARYGRGVLEEKIAEIAERRLGGEEDELA